MCGIFGQLDPAASPEARQRFATLAGAAVRHRGPDARGTFDDGDCLLGHARLSILDLSEAAAQPMRSASGRSVLVYNGELYNFVELRAALSSPEGGWRTSSDTEILLEAVERSGTKALDDFLGMFSFALWRPDDRELLLVRDRLGKKPLYWARTPRGGVRFASEVQALLADGVIRAKTSTDRIAEYLQYGYNLAPRTSFEGIESLEPGQLVRAKLRDDGSVEIRTERWWQLPAYEPAAPLAHDAWHDELQAIVEDAVRIRLRSDVPLGALLSGGVDSSIIALLARKHQEDLQTITIDFDQPEFSEAAYAEEVARHVGTSHRRIAIAPPTVADLNSVVEIFGELHGDVGTLPTLAACRGLREIVTVALAGNGGDEVMAGYVRYLRVLDALEKTKRVPGAARRAFSASASLYPSWLRGDGRLALYGNDVADVYASTMRQFPARRLSPLLRRSPRAWTDPTVAAATRYADRPALLQMMATDAVTYIPGDLNVSLDRASMSVALEMRCPFLDHRLFELIARGRPEWFIEGGRGKLPLRKLYAPSLPGAVFTRRKAGFAPPVEHWFRAGGELADRKDALLRGRAAIHDVLDRGAIARQVRAFDLRLHRNAGRLWNLLVLDTWLERWKPSFV